MAITKETIVGKIEVVTQFKHIQIRMDNVIKENGTELSRSYWRNAINCGSIDESNNFIDRDISGEHAEVQAICNAAWTQAVKDAW